jgi:hypothetical protein
MKSLSSGAPYLRAQQSAEAPSTPIPASAPWRRGAAASARRAEEMLMDAGGKRALDAIVKLAKPDGGIYDKIVPHYITAVSVMARRPRRSSGRPDSARREGPRVSRRAPSR